MNHSTGNGKKPTLLIALGGNALIQKGQEGTIAQQFENLRISIRQIGYMIESVLDAVIDKDLVSALLATEIGADLLVIATDVDGVFADFNTPDQRLISQMGIDDAEYFLSSSKNSKGSMEPKVEAALKFIQDGGRRAVITSIETICESVQGKAGTQIIK